MTEAPTLDAGLPEARRRWGRFPGAAEDGGRQQEEDSQAARRGAVREAIFALGEELAATRIPTEALVATTWSAPAVE